jgi:hypothetical protein
MSHVHPKFGLLAWLVAVSSLVLGCSEDQGPKLAGDSGTFDVSADVFVLNADSAADASGPQDRLDDTLGDGGTLIVDVLNPQDQSDDALGDGGVLVVDASATQDLAEGGPVDSGVEEFWTLAILPDTQGSYYHTPSFFDAQTRWIAENHVQERIAFVLHEGDIVDAPGDAGQWTAARASMGLLDGKVPYVLAVGNHDLGSNSTDAGVILRSTLINNYFLYDDVSRAPTFGGAFENGHVENTYHLLAGGGRTWLVISLEFSPRDAVVAWADQVLTAHANLPAILLTHAYLYSDGQRYDNVGRACNFGKIPVCTILDPSRNDTQCWNPICYMGEGSDGEMLWNSLVKVHSNLLFVFSGHVCNPAPFDAARLSSTRSDGTICHQLMADYQADGKTGGDGYFRLLRIWRNGRVQVSTYSPYVDSADAYLTEERNQFDLHIEIPGG